MLAGLSETLVVDAFRLRLRCGFKRRVTIVGLTAEHEFDFAGEKDLFEESPILILGECKLRKASRVTKAEMATFVHNVKDVEGHIGVFTSSAGFQAEAIKVAHANGIFMAIVELASNADNYERGQLKLLARPSTAVVSYLQQLRLQGTGKEPLSELLPIIYRIDRLGLLGPENGRELFDMLKDEYEVGNTSGDIVTMTTGVFAERGGPGDPYMFVGVGRDLDRLCGFPELVSKMEERMERIGSGDKD